MEMFAVIGELVDFSMISLAALRFITIFRRRIEVTQ
jgi:hypothetical protein